MANTPTPFSTNGRLATSDFASVVEEYRSRLNAELRRRLEAKRDKMADLASESTPLVEVLSDLILRGGKRLRPALVHFGYRACGGPDAEAALPLEVATELLHTYLLVHDDIMDNADVRRGGPAVHVHFCDEHRRRDGHGDAAHYGSSLAILAGNLAHAQAHECFTAACRAAPDAETLREAFSTMEEEVIEGQRLEMRLAQRREATPEQLERVIQLKSGRYSVERPLQLGALMADGSEAQIDAFGQFGAAAGSAFQLQDDLLGMFGDPDATGKPVGGDLREGKYTFLIHHTLQRSDPEERQMVKQALGNDSLADDEVQRVCDIMHRSGATARVHDMISDHLTKAREALETAVFEPDGETFLRGFIEYVGERNR